MEINEKYELIKWVLDKFKDDDIIPEWYTTCLDCQVIINRYTRLNSIVFTSSELMIEIRDDRMFFNEHIVQSADEYFNVSLIFSIPPYQYFLDLQELLIYHYNYKTLRFKL